ncbi:uncharacterized protein LOC135690667 isoform X3 [Rhopilema esculentum]|uniref:uncharacterized protein LOC135690667 isoform X3 n=1 Tax=Rhopilema esculentum TaxID=499914 RepID=UPI0031D136D2
MSDVAEKEPWNMSVAERVEFAKQMKEIGRRYFLDGLVEDAMESYRSGLKRLIPAYDLPHDLLSEQLPTYSVQRKIREYSRKIYEN